MLDRTQAPVIHQVSNVSLPEIEVYELPMGGKLFVHREQETHAFKLEILTQAGNIGGQNSAEVQLGLKMLNEGTDYNSGHKISEFIDSIGSFLEFSPGFDHSSISIYGLKKHFKENVSILSEMLYKASYTESSLELLKEKELNKLKMNLEKGSYISSVNLRESLFEGHPYSYSLKEDQVRGITSTQLVKFYENHIQSFDLYISGDLPQDFLQTITDSFNRNSQVTKKNEPKLLSQPLNAEYRNKKLIQSSIKLGKCLFNRTHPDYFKFNVMNEILGGYFGSRLMKNIREEKGYTYGIHSALYTLNEHGYFIISTDVKGEFETQTITEIRKEIRALQNELVSKEELQTVKSYMIGTFVNSFTTPFAAIAKFKTVNTQNLSLDFYRKYIENIRAVTSSDIIAMAQKYLDFNSLTQSIAGSE